MRDKKGDGEMARKIKFALEMADGTKVRTNIEELREHFDLESVMGYFLSGKLQEWLEDRYYEKEADEIANLNKDDAEIRIRLCEILGVEPPDSEEININSIELINKKKAMLRQVTDDESIIEHAAQVAFNQEELAELIECEEKIIYLCGKEFTIPAKVKDKKYIGVNNPQININAKTYQELVEKNIVLEGVKAPDNVLSPNIKTKQEIKAETDLQSLSLYERTKQLYGEEEANAEKLYLECKYDGLLDKFIELSNNGVERANYFIAQMYWYGYGDAILDCNINSEARQVCNNCSDTLAKIQGSYIHSKETGEFASVVDSLIDKLREMADAGDPFACFEIDGVYNSGYITITQEEANKYLNKSSELGNNDATFWIATRAELAKDYNKAIKYYEIASKNGHPNAQNSLGYMYERGLGFNKDLKKAFNLYSSSAKKGCVGAQYNLADCYYNGKGTGCDNEKAAFWYQKAAEKNFAEAQNMLGVCYACGYGVKQDYETAYFWYEKAAEKGDSWGQYNQGEMHIHKSDYYWNRNCNWADDLDEDYGINLLELSINQGNTSAMKLLAAYYKDEADNLYFDTNIDKIKALLSKSQSLYERAADNGDEESKSLLDDIKKNIKVRKLRAIYHGIEYDKSDSDLYLIKITDSLNYVELVDSTGRLTDESSFKLYGLDYNELISNINGYDKNDIVYVCANYDYKNGRGFIIDKSSMWCMTKDSLIIHDTNSMLIEVKKSFWRNKEETVNDIIIPYAQIEFVTIIPNEALVVKTTSGRELKVKLRSMKKYNEAMEENAELIKKAIKDGYLDKGTTMNDFKSIFKYGDSTYQLPSYAYINNPDKRAEEIGCWENADRLANCLNKILCTIKSCL